MAIWAFWERRRRKRSTEQLFTEGSETGLVPVGTRQKRIAELHTLPKPNDPLPELMDTGREYKEAPGSQPART